MSSVPEQARFQLFSPLPDDKYQALKADIQTNGVLVPVEIDQNGQVLDGHHRIRAWKELRAEGIQLSDYPRVIRSFDNDDDREEHAAKINCNRRDVSLDDKQDVARKWRARGWQYERIANALGISTATAWRWCKDDDTDNEDSQFSDEKSEAPDVITNERGQNRPASYNTKPKPAAFVTNSREQERALTAFDYLSSQDDDEDDTGEDMPPVDKSTGEILTPSQLHQQASQRRREQRRRDLEKSSAELTLDKKYRVIYADPPWKYGDERTGLVGYSAAVDHYPTMSISELQALPVNELAQDNAVLFLWATSPLLPDALSLIEAWGFTYKSSFIWDKVRHNVGHYNSVRHELLLIATRGSCTPDVKKLFDSVQVIERTDKHSEKPEEFRQIIDTLYPPTGSDRIELFRRGDAPEGWKVWGNESAAA